MDFQEGEEMETLEVVGEDSQEVIHWVFPYQMYSSSQQTLMEVANWWEIHP